MRLDLAQALSAARIRLAAGYKKIGWKLAALTLLTMFVLGEAANAAFVTAMPSHAPQGAPAMTVPGQFGVSSTGAATYTMPISVPPGTHGMVPSLSLSYASSGGDGIMGLGWSLNGLPVITRCPQTTAQDSVHGGVNNDINDRFCLNGQRLMLVSGTYGIAGSVYHTEIESFSQITVSTGCNGPCYFVAKLKNGITINFGTTTDSRIVAVNNPWNIVRAWAVSKVIDRYGNYYTVTYNNGTPDTTNGQFYPTRIDYTGHGSALPYNSVQFLYNTSRPDQTPTYQGGSLVQTTALLTEIQTYAGATQVLDYKLGYRLGSSKTHSRLTSVTLCDGTLATCDAVTSFGWQGGSGAPSYTSYTPGTDLGLPALYSTNTGLIGDLDGDGLTDLLNGGCSSYVSCFGSTSGSFVGDARVGGTVLANAGGAPIDIDGDGRADFAAIFAVGLGPTLTTSLYWNEATGTTRTLTKLSAYSGYTIMPLFGDFDGDGRTDFWEMLSNGTAQPLHISNGDGTFSTTITSVASVTGSGDFDGDGCADIASAHYNATSGVYDGTVITYSCQPGGATSTTAAPGPTSNLTGDFNGDGKTDILGWLATGWQKWTTGGNNQGFAAMASAPPSNVVAVGDFDGDGRADLLVQDTAHSKFEIYLSTGNGFVDSLVSVPDPGAVMTVFDSGDWNNDGVTDFVVGNSSGTSALFLSNYTPEVIQTITNGIGAKTTVTYNRMNDGTIYTKGTTATYPTQDVNNAKYLVSKVTALNGAGGSTNQTYAYSGAQQDLSGRGFLGFGDVTVTDNNTVSGTTLVTDTSYSTTFPTIGLVTSVNVTHGATVMQTVNNVWDDVPLGSGIHFVSLHKAMMTHNKDLNGASLPTKTTVYTYDCDSSTTCYGDTTQIAATVSDGSSSTTNMTYTDDTTHWILGELTFAATENILPSGSDKTRKVSFAYDPTTGFQTQEIIQPGSCEVSVEYDYTPDVYGNRTATQTSGVGCASDSYQTAIHTRTEHVTYDSYGRFVTSATNALGEADTRVYDPAFGGLLSYTDPNGITTTWQPDALGRPNLQNNPGSTGTVVQYGFALCSTLGGPVSCPSRGAYAQTAETFAHGGVTQVGATTTTYFDMLDRPIATDTQGFNGSSISRVATVYDANLNVAETSRPYYVGGSPQWTTYTYDDLGRSVLAQMPDTSQTSYAYNGLSGSVTNDFDSGIPVGAVHRTQTTLTTLNAQGLAASVQDPASNTTSYSYDAFNNLIQVTDSAGNVTTALYDMRGNMVRSNDPDRGVWSYTYDVLDDLIGQTTARGKNTTITYDDLQRARTRQEAAMYSTWDYGTSLSAKNIDKLTDTKTCAPAGCTTVITEKQFGYDSLSRPNSTAITIDGNTYNYATSYNPANGAIASVTYPSGFVLNNVYNTYGYTCRKTDYTGTPTCTSTGGTNYWTANTVDAEMHLTQQTAGNTVVTNQTFDAQTGRILTQRAGPAGAVAGFDYIWDPMGNLMSREDEVNGFTEYFCYDAQENRLTHYVVSATASCTATGYKTVNSNAIGNIGLKSDVGTYNYNAPGGVQPHAVQSITGTVNGVVNPLYTYDADGNMTAGAGISAVFNSFDMPNSVSEASGSAACFTYDSNHQRIKQLIVSGSCTSATYANTTYLNDPASGAMSEMVTTGGTPAWHDFISANGQIVAERYCTGAAPCSTGATSNYFTLDHLGSIAVVANGSGVVSATNGRLSYDAWGRRRNSADGSDNPACSITSSTTRGFTNQEQIDPLCLVNLNARIYDPTLGRFMSADSIVPDQYDSQSYNRYSYVNSRPLSATDPTGHDGWNIYLQQVDGGGGDCPSGVIETVCVTGTRNRSGGGSTGINLGGASAGGPPSLGGGGGGDDGKIETVIVTAKRRPSPSLTTPIASPPFTPGRCPAGPQEQFTAGGSATVAVFLGLTLSGNVGVSYSADPKDVVAGMQVFGNLSLAGHLGLGAFIGAGVQAGGGKSDAPLPSGFSSSFPYDAEIEGGYIVTLGLNAQADPESDKSSSVSGSVALPLPKIGAGIGGYVGAGRAVTITLASPQLFCN